MIFHSHVSLPEGTKHGNHQHLMACSGTPRHPTSGGSGSTTVYCSCRFRGNTDTVEILEKETTRLQVVLGKVDSNWCSLKGKSNIPTILLGIQSDWCWWTRPEINGTADIVHKIAHTRNEVLSGIFVCTYTTVNPQNKIRNMGVYYNIRIPYIYISYCIISNISTYIYIISCISITSIIYTIHTVSSISRMWSSSPHHFSTWQVVDTSPSAQDGEWARSTVRRSRVALIHMNWWYNIDIISHDIL